MGCQALLCCTASSWRANFAQSPKMSQGFMSKLIKKYTNRRLYDTDESRYITLDELAQMIRSGHDVQVVDASNDTDLTQATLAQIVVESRGAAKLLPVPLLTQMIRMEDDALAEFMSLYLTWSLDLYSAMKTARSSSASEVYSDFMHRYAQMASMPLTVAQGGIKLFKDRLEGKDSSKKKAAPKPTPPPEPAPDRDSEVDSLREELNEIKEMLKGLTAAKSKK